MAKAYKFQTTPERSSLMKKIRSQNTRPELLLRKALSQRGIRYRLNYSKLPGKPDVALTKQKIAIFIDGEFWHGYKWNQKKDKIKANRSHWIPKIERTIERDKRNNSELRSRGYIVLRFWENEIKTDLESCVRTIVDLRNHFEEN